ncbi:MAG: DUF983 domain-containing protein [Planctomycetaceae bacterium]
MSGELEQQSGLVGRRPTLTEMLGRAVRLRCPRCGEGKLFKAWFRMHVECSGCNFHYERAPGYFLGASYISYGITALTITVIFILGRFQFGATANQLIVPLAILAVLLPLSMFRHARGLWMAFDCYFDSSVLADEDRPN